MLHIMYLFICHSNGWPESTFIINIALSRYGIDHEVHIDHYKPSLTRLLPSALISCRVVAVGSFVETVALLILS